MDATQLLKGVLDLAVLAALRHDDGYGYAGRDELRRYGKVWRSFASTMDTLLDDDRGMVA